MTKMNCAMKEIIKDGFMAINQTDKDYVVNLRKNLDKYYMHNNVKNMKPIEKVLSVRNSQTKKYKIISLLGIQFKIKRI